jgi:hypothetical protein
MAKSHLDLMPSGSGVLDLAERTGMQRLVARWLEDLSESLGKVEVGGWDFG